MTAHGLAVGWTVEWLCDDALAHAGLTLASGPRTPMAPLPGPFRRP